jgi:O-antigen ligase
MVLWNQNKYLLTSFLLVSILMSWFLYHEEYQNILILWGSVLFVITFSLFISDLKKILLFIIFLTPLSIDILLSGGFKISAPTEIMTVLLAAIFFSKWAAGFTWKKEIFKHPISILLLLDLIWSSSTIVFSQNPEIVFKRLILKTLFIGVFYFLSAQLLSKKTDQKKLFWLYGLGLIIPIITTFYNHSLLGLLQSSSVYVCQPFFNDHTIYAACIAFIIPFFTLQIFHHPKTNLKLFSGVLLATLIAAMVFSYSRAAWISLGASLLFYLATRFKIQFWQIMSGIIIFIIVIFMNFNPIYDQLKQNEVKYDNDVSTHITSVTNLQNDASNLERINRWVCAYRMFVDKPITGHGSGTYQFVYDQYQTPEFMTRISSHHGNKGNAHSEYLTYLSENGIIGFLIFTALVFYSIYMALKLLYTDISQNQKTLIYSIILGLITFYTHGLFNTFSDYDKMAVLYLGGLAILVRMDLKIKYST